MKIFISGPMTGFEHFNFPKFDAWEKKLNAEGHQAVNPAHISRKFKKAEILAYGDKFKQMVSEQLELEKSCDAILLLDGWEKSQGVRAELKTAIELDLKIILESNYDTEC